MSLADESKLLLIPSGYKSGKVYSVFPTNGGGDFTFSRSGNASRVNPGGYIETVGTNIPRIDHTGGGCPSLLLEPTRTNLVTHSESFASWGDSGVNVSSNVLISPDGTMNADKLQSTASNWRKSDAYTVTNGAEYTVSIYAKLDTSTSTTTARIEIYRGVNSIASTFNLSTGAISGSISNTFIESVGNDWFRIGGTYVSNGTTNIFYIYPSSGYSQAGTMFFWGAQAEQGGYKTSQIKTSGGIITRQQDFCINGGDSSLFNVNELSLFIDAKNFKRDNGTLSYIVLTDGQSSPINMIRIEYKQDRIGVAIYSNGSFILGYNIYSVIPNQRNKLLLTFDNNVAKTYFNGVLRNTYTSIVIPSGLDSLSFTNRTENAYSFQGEVNDVRFYDRALTQNEAIELTTL